MQTCTKLVSRYARHTLSAPRKTELGLGEEITWTVEYASHDSYFFPLLTLLYGQRSHSLHWNSWKLAQLNICNPNLIYIFVLGGGSCANSTHYLSKGKNKCYIYVSTIASNWSCVNRWAKDFLQVACSVWASEVFVGALGIQKRKVQESKETSRSNYLNSLLLTSCLFQSGFMITFNCIIKIHRTDFKNQDKDDRCSKKRKAVRTLPEYSLPVDLFETNWKFSLIKAYAAYMFQKSFFESFDVHQPCFNIVQLLLVV